MSFSFDPPLNTTLIISIIGIIVSVFTLFLTSFFYYLQHRVTKAPIYRVDVLGEKNKRGEPSPLELDPVYLKISNTSKNSANNIVITLNYKTSEKKMLFTVKKEIAYLNPNESAFTNIGIGDWIDKKPKDFCDVERETIKIKYPKCNKIFYIFVDVKTKSNFFMKYKQKDQYKIEWRKPIISERLEVSPYLFCWNLRKGSEIVKFGDPYAQ